MKFQVFKDNKCMFVTTDKTCIPTKDILYAQSKAGYTFKLDGKKISYKSLIKEIKC